MREIKESSQASLNQILRRLQLEILQIRLEHVQAIVTLRSGRQVDNHVVDSEVDTTGQEREESGNMEERDAKPSTATPIVKDPPRSFVPKAPYPERLQGPKKEGKFEDILEVFKQVQINIPFLDAI